MNSTSVPARNDATYPNQAILMPVPSREQIEALQRELAKLPQCEPQTQHYFADGMYLRTVFRRRGVCVVGKVHKKEHFFIVLSGEMSIWTEEGMKRVEGPFVWVSKPGTKRVTYAHTDATAMTMHQVTSLNLDEIEEELVEEDASALFGSGNATLNILDHDA